MKESELREVCICSICGKKIGEAGSLDFYRVTIQRWSINLAAVQRQTGLAMMLGGNGELARVMGPDEEMAHKVSSSTKTVCYLCGLRVINDISVQPGENGEEEDNNIGDT
jgi:hypothetical protein